jgi:hypothetical protein
MRSRSDVTNNYKGPLIIALQWYPQIIIYVAVFVILELYDAMV